MSHDAREWNLDHVLPVEGIEPAFQELEESIPQTQAFVGKLAPNMSTEDFRAYCERDEKLTRTFRRLSSRQGLAQDVDKDDQNVNQLVSRVEELSVRVSEAERPINHWLQGKSLDGVESLDDENARRLFAVVPDLEYSLLHSRTLARHTLSKPEEDIISVKDTNLQTALTGLRDRIEKNQRYRFKPEGAKRARIFKTGSEVRALFESPKAVKREAAYKANLDVYQRNEELYFDIYSAVVKDWADETKRRQYPSSISMRNVANNIPDEAIETLMQACKENATVFQEYFRWKAKKLGMEKLRRYDIYAPITAVEEKATLDKGITIVLDTFKQVSTRFHDYAKRIIDEGHIHSHPSPKKTGGAYCSTIEPDIAPYILLNWQGKANDISTLAHELGHGVHALYATHHSACTQHSPLPLAETASTFAESILFDRGLQEATSDAVRASMLSDKIGDSYATIIRQNNFVRFEQMAHERIPKGITRDELSALWLTTLHDQFGDAVEVDPNFRYEWAYIPHIVESPFYCYSYSFGELLSLSLYNRYRQDPSYFSQIERILEAGGAQEPDAVLKRAGVDMRDPAFWQGSFDLIRGWQKQLETYDSAGNQSTIDEKTPISRAL